MAVPDQQGPRNIHSDGGWDCTFPLSLLWASLLIVNIGSTGAKGRLVTNNLPLTFHLSVYLFIPVCTLRYPSYVIQYAILSCTFYFSFKHYVL